MLKMAVFLKLIHRLHAIPVKTLASYFVDMKTDSTVYMERHKTQNGQNNIEGEQS